MKQIEKLILKETKGLPPYALNEILDFIQFIKEKKLKKKGEGLHHVCFITTNVNDATNTLVDNSARLTSKPRPGDTFNDELIAFLYVRFGLNIELIHTNERRDLISLE